MVFGVDIVRWWWGLWWRLVSGLVIGSALLLLAARLLLPEVGHYRALIEGVLSRQLGVVVTIGSIDGRWRGFGPELEVRQLHLYDPISGEGLQLRHLRTNLDLLHSLRSGQWTARELRLEGLDLQLLRHPDGRVTVAGLAGVAGERTTALSLPGVPRQIRITDSTLRFSDQSGRLGHHQLTAIDLTLRRHAEQLQIEARSDSANGRLHAIAELEGNPYPSTDWSGVIYARGEALKLPQLLGHWLPAGVQIEEGEGKLELWSHWQQGRLARLQGNAAFAPLVLGVGSEQLAIDQLDGRFGWQRRGAAWQLELEQLRLTRHQQPRSELHRATLAWQPGAPRGRWYAHLDSLELLDLLELARLAPPPHHPALEALQRLAPRARIAALEVSVEEAEAGEEPVSPAWSLRGEVQQLHTLGMGSLPALRNLSGHLVATPQRGSITLDSHASEVLFSPLFRESLHFDRLSGAITWQMEAEEGLTIRSEGLRARNPDLDTLTRLHLRLPASGWGEAEIDLMSEFRGGDAAQTSRYLPVTIMNQRLVEWLDRSIVSGQVTHGTFQVRGRLADFPYDDAETGHFEVRFAVEEGVLDYHPDWPPIHEIRATLRFLASRLDITASHGRIYHGTITQATVSIDDLDPVTPLQIAGRVESSAADALRLLAETPLQQRLGTLTTLLTASGPVGIALDLEVPFGSEPITLAGEITLRDTTLQLPDWDLHLEGSQGTLQFDLDGVRSDNLRSELLGHPLALTLAPSPDHPGHTQIQANAQLPLTTLRTRYPQLAALPASGASDWQLTLDLPPLQQPTPLYLEITSPLRGIAIDLPPPLGKAAATSRPLRLRTQLRPGTPSHLELTYSEGLDLRLTLAAESDEAGIPPSMQSITAALGNASRPALPTEANGLWLAAALEELDLAAWQKLLGSGEGALPLPPLQQLTLQADTLHWDGPPLDQLTLSVQRHPDHWQATVAAEQISATLNYPKDPEQGRARLHLQRLHLPPPAQESATAASESAAEQEPNSLLQSHLLDPRIFPAFDLLADAIFLGEEPLGSLEIRAERHPEGLHLTPIRLHAPATQLTGEGYWRFTAAEAGEATSHTELTFTLDSDSLGNLLAALQLTSNLQQAPTTLRGQLEWPGHPGAPQLANLHGTLQLALGQGSVPELDPGLGRLLGLLNLTSLQRRLTLDFSDFTGEGFSFDRIDGTFQFSEGVAHIEGLRIDGPAARIRIDGSSDLEQRTLDYRVAVSGKLSSALPLAGALTGGPAVGVVLLIAQHLLGDKVDRISTVEYQISGPWEQPEVVRIEAQRETGEVGEWDYLSPGR